MSSHTVTRRGLLAAPPATLAAQVFGTGFTVAPSNSLDQCAQRFQETLRPGDELYDYFRCGLEILHRAAQAARGSGSASFMDLYRRVLAGEFEFLRRFYLEELDVVQERRKDPDQWIRVTDHGLKGDGTLDNRVALIELLDRVRRSPGRTTVVFPEGVYRFSADRVASGGATVAIHLANLHGVSFIGEGEVKIVADGQSTPCTLMIERCRDLQIRNLILDIDPPPYTAGVVTSANPESNEFDMETLPGCRSPVDPVFLSSELLRGKLHHPDTGAIDPRGGDPRVVSVTQLEQNRFRLKVARSDLSAPPGLTAEFRPGMIFSLHARSDSGRGNGIDIRASEHVLIRGITMHGASAHAVTAVDSAGLQFIDCLIEPAPGRYALNTADGFHIRGNRKGPYLERCAVEKTNDDCLNFYARASSVLATPDKATLVLPASDGAAWRQGDLIAILNPNNGAVDCLNVIAAIRQTVWRNSPALALEFREPFPLALHSRDSTGRGPVSGREYTPSGGEAYKRAMAIQAPFEHFAANLNCKNDGFLIRNCRMGNNRGSGFKCKASNGLVENWRLANPSMGSGILFRIELDWREAFFPHNVLLRGCRLGGQRPVSSGAGLPGQKKLASQDLPWLRDLELVDCWDEHGLRPVRFRL